MSTLRPPRILRTLARNPGASATAILVLALGVGLATAMFSLVDGFLLRQLPVENGERLVHLKLATSEARRGGSERSVPLSTFLDWRRDQRVFEDLAAFDFTGVSVSDGSLAHRYPGALLTPSSFELLDVAPALGRTFDPGDQQPGAPPVVLLGDSAWRNQFAADPSVVGRSVLVDGRAATVIGVMPEGFLFPLREEVWLPLQIAPNPPDGDRERRVDVFGRLRDEVGLDRARLEMTLLARRLADEGEGNDVAGSAPRVLIAPYAQEFMGGARRDRTIWLGLGAGLLVLLVACANVTNLLLARARTRARETAVRSVLGAGRLRLILGSLAESLALALPGSLLGLGFAALGIRLLATAVESAGQRDWPYWIELRVGGAEVLAGLVLALLATLLTGILPGLRSARIDLVSALAGSRAGWRRRSGRWPLGLVGGQVALATILLVGTGLMVRSLVNLATLDFPIDADRVLSAHIALPAAQYPDDASRMRFWRALQEDLAALPGVEASALTDSVPGPYLTGRIVYRAPEDRSIEAESAPWAHRAIVSPGTFDALGADLLEGRDFSLADDEEAEPVAIVNRSLARREWPRESPIGRRLLLGEEPTIAVTVVGVAPDLAMDGLRDRFQAGLYRPLAQSPTPRLSVVASTAGDPTALVPPLRQRVAAIDPTLPLDDVQTIAELLDEGMFFYRMVGTIFTVLGVAALLLAASGIYANLTSSISRRTAEMGIRMALGATARDVRRLIVRQGTLRVAGGLVVGMLVAPLLALGLSRQLYDVRSLDPTTFVGIPVLLIAVAVVASLAPARRATRADPARSLREQ